MAAACPDRMQAQPAPDVPPPTAEERAARERAEMERLLQDEKTFMSAKVGEGEG